MSGLFSATVLNVCLKLLGFSVILYLFDLLVPSLYATYLPLALTVVILTVTGAAADLFVVPRLGNLKSLALGFPAMAFIIWAVAKFWPYDKVTPGWAVIMALFTGMVEYPLHNMILKFTTGRPETRP